MHEFPNRPPAWEIAAKTFASPSTGAITIALTALPALVAIVLVRQRWLQMLLLAPFIMLLVLVVFSFHPGHHCDRKGSNVGVFVFLVLTFLSMPVAALSLVGVALHGLTALWRNTLGARAPSE